MKDGMTIIAHIGKKAIKKRATSRNERDTIRSIQSKRGYLNKSNALMIHKTKMNTAAYGCKLIINNTVKHAPKARDKVILRRVGSKRLSLGRARVKTPVASIDSTKTKYKTFIYG